MAGVYAECAAVCFSRHHRSPTELVLDAHDAEVVECTWATPSEREMRAHANVDDATRDAAYGVAIAAIEVSLDMRAIDRAETRSGADYYIGSASDAPVVDLERAMRLEVSVSTQGSSRMCGDGSRRKWASSRAATRIYRGLQRLLDSGLGM